MDGLNWYAYCNNNPVNFVDPLGLYYLIAWSYGKSDLNGYINTDGTIDWERFTNENSFARAAYTKKQEFFKVR